MLLACLRDYDTKRQIGVIIYLLYNKIIYKQDNNYLGPYVRLQKQLDHVCHIKL